MTPLRGITTAGNKCWHKVESALMMDCSDLAKVSSLMPALKKKSLSILSDQTKFLMPGIHVNFLVSSSSLQNPFLFAMQFAFVAKPLDDMQGENK